MPPGRKIQFTNLVRKSALPNNDDCFSLRHSSIVMGDPTMPLAAEPHASPKTSLPSKYLIGWNKIYIYENVAIFPFRVDFRRSRIRRLQLGPVFVAEY